MIYGGVFISRIYFNTRRVHHIFIKKRKKKMITHLLRNFLVKIMEVLKLLLIHYTFFLFACHVMKKYNIFLLKKSSIIHFTFFACYRALMFLKNSDVKESQIHNMILPSNLTSDKVTPSHKSVVSCSIFFFLCFFLKKYLLYMIIPSGAFLIFIFF